METFNRPPNDQRESYQSLSQFDEELQQQAQLALEQEMEAWKDFENYLPPVDYRQYNQPIINNQLMDINTNNNNMMNLAQPNLYNNQWDETNQINQHLSPHSSFGSPDSFLDPSDINDKNMYQQHPSPISAYHTPSETPTNSPKNDIYPTTNFQQNNNPTYQGKNYIFFKKKYCYIFIRFFFLL